MCVCVCVCVCAADLCNEERHLVAVKLIGDIALDVNVRHFGSRVHGGSVSKELDYSSRGFAATGFSLYEHAPSGNHC